MLKKTIFGLALSWTVLVAFLCLFSFTKLSSFGVSGTDKYVHFTFHFVFTLLWGYYSWLNHNKIDFNKIVTIVFISLCYGILIEFLQEEFTIKRHADIFDVLANLSGAIIAFLVFVFIKKNKSRNKPSLN